MFNCVLTHETRIVFVFMKTIFLFKYSLCKFTCVILGLSLISL